MLTSIDVPEEKIERELAEAFGRPVDLSTKKWLKPRVRERVLPEARVVYAA